MRYGLFVWINHFLQKGERQLIRVIILGSVLLLIMQLGLAKDPVQFYLAMAQEVESPSLELNTSAQANALPASSQGGVFSSVNSPNQTRVWQITLKAIPKVPVRVLQNGKVLGTLAIGQQIFSVQTGIVQLDATNINQMVQVQVIKCDPFLSQPQLNQVFVCNGDSQEIWVGP